jgi:hypothetical protein
VFCELTVGFTDDGGGGGSGAAVVAFEAGAVAPWTPEVTPAVAPPVPPPAAHALPPTSARSATIIDLHVMPEGATKRVPRARGERQR